MSEASKRTLVQFDRLESFTKWIETDLYQRQKKQERST